MHPGDVLKNWSVTLEKNDKEAEDPFALPSKKGLKSYWVHYNSWSMDGLPGFKGIEHKADKGLIHKVMAEVGLNPSETSVKRGSSEWWMVFFVGIVLGVLLPRVVNGGLSTVAHDLRHLIRV